MASYVTPKKNAQYIFYISLVSQANTKVFQANPTLAAADFNVATDDGAPAALGTTPVVDADFTKRVKVTLSAAEMNGDNITLICSDSAGSEWCDLTINIQTSARQVDDLAYPATSGRSMVVDAAGLVDSNVVKVGPTGSGTAQTAGDIIGDTNDIQTRLPAALVSGRMDASVGAMAANTLTAAATAADFGTEIAGAVWNEDATGHQTQGTFGQVLGDSGADADSIWALANTNLDAAVSSRMASYTQPTGFLAATFPAGTVANTTNITAGTITTCTNLTNAPTSGDLTATMKTSVTTAATAATPTAAAVTGAVGSVTAGVSLSAAAVQSVWDALTSALTTVGSIGKKLADWTIGTAQTGDAFARLGAPAGASVSADIAAAKADTAAIKTKTDSLTFTAAGKVDANVKAVNDTTINGAGTAGNPWGP